VNLYAFIIIASVIIYIEVTRKKENTKVMREIKKAKREVKYQLNLLSQMLTGEEYVEPTRKPNTAHSSKPVKLATVLERNEEH
jgi:hypothetical protein